MAKHFSKHGAAPEKKRSGNNRSGSAAARSNQPNRKDGRITNKEHGTNKKTPGSKLFG